MWRQVPISLDRLCTISVLSAVTCVHKMADSKLRKKSPDTSRGGKRSKFLDHELFFQREEAMWTIMTEADPGAVDRVASRLPMCVGCT